MRRADSLSPQIEFNSDFICGRGKCRGNPCGCPDRPKGDDYHRANARFGQPQGLSLHLKGMATTKRGGVKSQGRKLSGARRLLPTAYCLLPAVFCLFVLFQVTARASDLSDFIGRKVTSVEVQVEGAPGGATTELRDLLEISTGQDFSPVRVHDSLVRLHRSGLVSGARVEGAAAGSGGVALTFIVKPQPRIENVVFGGTEDIPADDLKSRLNELDPGEKLQAGAVARGLGEIKAYYSARGFYQAEVTSDIQFDPSGTRATVVYTINPGPQAVVSSYTLNINGSRVDLSKLNHAIVENKPFQQADVESETERIKQVYLQQDYLAVMTRADINPDVNENKVAVTVTVNSGPHVEVEIEGLELSDKTKRNTLPFYTRGSLDEFTIEEGRRRLEDYAQRQGYFFAEVEKPAPPDLSGASVALRYVVNTGRRYKLSDIEIEGLDAIPHKTLEDQFKSKIASFIPLFGLNRGKTSNDLLRQDSSLVLKQLRDIGYRKAQVEVLRGVKPDSEDLVITFNVKQGPRTYVDQIGIQGNAVLTTTELSEELEIEPLDPLVLSDVTNNADRLLAVYNRRGYADAEVTTELFDLGSFDGQDRVRLIYNVTEGNRVRIANITTRGTALTDNGRLKRDFYIFKEGDYLRNDELQQTERVLYDTDAFNSVNITTTPVGTTANGVEQRDVTVNLYEAKRWLLIYGFGFQTTSSSLVVPGLGFLNGARGLVQLTNTNLFGKLYTGTTQLRVSQDELFGQISFQNPRPFGIEWPALISLFARRLAEQSFNSDRYTATFQVEKRLTPESILYLAYNFERISIYNLNVNPDEIERNRQAIRLGRIGPSYARDTRDRASEPTKGTLTTGSLSLASTAFGGTEQFVKLLVEHNRYYPIKKFRDTVYAASGRLGLAAPFGGKQTLPISERFFAGGSRDLRGFDFEEAGPQDPDTGRPLGGNAVFVLNNELRFPIYGILGGAVFSDTGNVFARVRDFRPQNLTETIGFGLRLSTPVGPVRVDFGYLVFNRPDGVPSSQIHFSFGSTF